MSQAPTLGAPGRVFARAHGGRARRRRAHKALPALLLTAVGIGGCASRPADPALMDSLAEMEIRVRLLQSELTELRRAMAESQSQATETDQPDATQELLESRFDALQARIDALPEVLAAACPARQEPAMNAQCEPQIQRVVVSGDKLVVGLVERVWVDPPGAFLQARIDAGAEYSFIAAEEPMEFERDGNKWIRFGVTVDEQTVSVERPLKRFTRVRNERRPIVDLRVQLGDARENVEFVLTDLSGQEQRVVLGRNFLTDVALLDVGRQHVQPRFPAPNR